MANTTNTQQSKNFENIKGVKSNVLDVAKELQLAAAKAKQRAKELADVISQRKAEFRSTDEVADEQPVVADVVENVVLPPQSEEKTEVAVAEQPEKESVVAQPVVVEEKKTEKPKKAKKEAEVVKEKAETVKEKTEQKPAEKAVEKPTEKEAKPVENTKPTTTVVVTNENGREVKTYTDEKGNVKVRKFLDTSAMRRNATPSGGKQAQGQQRGSRTGAGSQQKDGRLQGNRNGTDNRRPAQGQGAAKTGVRKFTDRKSVV